MAVGPERQRRCARHATRERVSSPWAPWRCWRSARWPVPRARSPAWGFFLNDSWGATANHVFKYGRTTDEVLIGDWDGDGTDSITVRRGDRFYVSNEP